MRAEARVQTLREAADPANLTRLQEIILASLVLAVAVPCWARWGINRRDVRR